MIFFSITEHSLVRLPGAAKTFGKQSKATKTFGKQTKATKTFGKQSKAAKTLMPTLPPYLRLPLLQQHARSGFSFYRGREEAVHLIVYDDLLWNALMVERPSKQYDHVHTFHR